MSVRQVLRDAVVVDADRPPFRADVAVADGLVQAVGAVPAEPDDVVLDCAGRMVVPGFVDVHSHVDGAVFDDGVQLALLRQGVTTVIGGQDGVSYAPGDGAYASEYFAGVNGPHPTYRGTTVGELLATYDGTTRLNVAYLVPAGTVRWEVMGRAGGPAGPAALARMVELVRDGLRDGAVGLSTGLDYVPGLLAGTDEIAALCVPVAEAGAVHVTHMRGGYESGSPAGVAEVARISAATGVAAHVSHFHADADIVLGLLAQLDRDGVDTTFDAYPYTRGCTLLAMPLLPPELVIRPVPEVLDVLASPDGRAALRRDWFPLVAEKPSLGPDWPTMITLAHVPSPEYAWAQGLTLAQAAERAGCDPVDLALDVLAASRLEANAVMAVRHDRSVAELGRILASDHHLGGSDGIVIGAHPHPRARGSFARYLRQYVRETGVLTWPAAVDHLARRPVARFGLGLRGRVRPGWVADLAVVDPDAVADRATYDAPHALAVGIDDVLVAGVPVLRAGALTDPRPGRGLRRTTSRTSSTDERNDMTKTAVTSTDAPKSAGPYSQGIVANGFFYSAGFGPQDPATGAVAADVGEQTRQVLRNVSAVLAERGLTLDDAVKVTVHLQNLKEDFSDFNAAYEEFFTAPYPVRTTVGSQLADILVEIDVVAALPAGHAG